MNYVLFKPVGLLKPVKGAGFIPAVVNKTGTLWSDSAGAQQLLNISCFVNVHRGK